MLSVQHILRLTKTISQMGSIPTSMFAVHHASFSQSHLLLKEDLCESSDTNELNAINKCSSCGKIEQISDDMYQQKTLTQRFGPSFDNPTKVDKSHINMKAIWNFMTGFLSPSNTSNRTNAFDECIIIEPHIDFDLCRLNYSAYELFAASFKGPIYTVSDLSLEELVRVLTGHLAEIFIKVLHKKIDNVKYSGIFLHNARGGFCLIKVDEEVDPDTVVSYRVVDIWEFKSSES